MAATSRRLESLDELKKQFGHQLWTSPLDVTNDAAVRRVTTEAFEAFKQIDVVVSNAGYGLFGAGEEVTDEQIREQLNTNLIGSIQVIRAALPHLRQQGGGQIVQVSSEGGQVAFPNFSIYHASKWGIEGFVEAIALEVAPFGIRCTIIEPGPTKTGFSGRKVTATAMEVYADTPAGDMRRALSFSVKGDAARTVAAMIESIDKHPERKRLTLGSDAFNRVRAVLTERLATLDSQKDIAYSADASAKI